jgi:predicted phosphate transport protein (TIGR00153 family)
MSLFYKSPFENLKRHADKVSECARVFNEAMKCHLDQQCEAFDDLTDQVAILESEADSIKRNIRGHLPRGILMPVDKFQFFMYLREQDKVLDAVEESLYWLSYRPEGIQKGDIKEDMLFFVEKLLPAIEALSPLVEMASVFFKSASDQLRQEIKSVIRDIRQHEHEADHLERELIHKIFTSDAKPMNKYHLIRLVETMGTIADHAQNASDMMRAMIAE